MDLDGRDKLRACLSEGLEKEFSPVPKFEIGPPRNILRDEAVDSVRFVDITTEVPSRGILEVLRIHGLLETDMPRDLGGFQDGPILRLLGITANRGTNTLTFQDLTER